MDLKDLYYAYFLLRNFDKSFELYPELKSFIAGVNNTN